MIGTAQLMHCIHKYPGMCRIDFRMNTMTEIENMPIALAKTLQYQSYLLPNPLR